MRESPTSVAPPYITGPTSQACPGQIRCASLVTLDAAAKAIVVCPEGNDDRSSPENPFPNLKSRGFVSFVT